MVRRVSELLALRWRDVDFASLELNVTRSIWHQVVGDCKTEASAKPVPLDSYMAQDLLRWRRQSAYSQDDHYVFASETMKGEQPYWPDNLMKRHIRPVAKANGIHKRIGWHTFRHTFGTLLKANGEDVKTVQELKNFTARQQQNNAGGVHASRHRAQASRTEQGCQDDGFRFG